MTAQHEVRVGGTAVPRPPAAGSGRYRRSERALWRATTRGVVILPAGGEPMAVTGAAVSLWDLLADGLAISEITTRLSARFDVAAGEVRALIAPVLDELVASGAVVEGP